MSIKFSRCSKADEAEADLAVIVRAAAATDREALRRLAERDSSPLPAEPLIVAEVEGEIRAAVSIPERAAVADPFHRTAEVAALAEMRAAQLRATGARRPRIVARTPRPPSRTVRPAG